MSKTIRRELSPLIKVDDKTVEITNTVITTEVVTSKVTISELRKQRTNLLKAIEATEAQKQYDIRRHDDTIANLNAQIQLVDTTISNAIGMNIVEEEVVNAKHVNPQAGT